MLTHETTPGAGKTSRLSWAAFGVLLCAGAYTTPAGASDSADASPVEAPLYGYLGETRARPGQQRTGRLDDVRHADGLVRISTAPVDASPSDLLARLHHAFGSELRLSSDRAPQGDREVLLSNSDALVRARIRLTLGDQFGFVYADMGARDSALKWQGLAGIRGGHGIDLLGGWRHVTYHPSPGVVDLLDFNGPYLGATLAW
jgi:hypothetical protein